MSFRDCIMSNELLSKAQRDSLIKEYDSLLAYNDTIHGPVEASQRATQNFIQSKIDDIEAKKRASVLSALTADKLFGADGRIMKSAEARKARKNKGAKWAKFFYWNSDVAGALADDFQKTAYYAGARAAEYQRSIADVILKYSSKYAGLMRDSDGFVKVVREVLGDNTGDAGAKTMAGDVSRMLNSILNDYRAAGGKIGEIRKGYFPQRDIYESILATAKKAGFADEISARNFWKTQKLNLVDLNRMRDPRTSMPYTPEKLDAAMDEIWEQMKTGSSEELGDVANRQLQLGGEGDIFDRKSAHRFFIYKNADAFMQNADMFGGGKEALFDSMIDYINGMSRDTVTMERYGPKAGAVAKIGVSFAKTDGAKPQILSTLKGMYDTVSGANAYGGQVGAFTKTLEGTQHWLRASYLGGALISSVSDSFWLGMTAKYNGLSASKAIANQAKYLNPLNSTDRMIAQKNAFLSQAISGATLRQSLNGDYASGAGVARWASGFVNRAGGLNIWVDAIRTAIPIETQSMFSSLKSMKASFDDLDPALKDAFARWDMNEVDYKNIISAEPRQVDANGATLIAVEDVARVNQETARKYGAWLYEMSQVASNEPALLTRTITTGAIYGGDATRGSWARNLNTTLFMFKSYGITVLLNHIIPAIQRGGSEGKWGRAAAIMVGLPLLGAMSLQAKDVIYGKTPRDMDNTRFWREAFLQSGVFGYYSDFIFADATKYGYSSGKTFAGPVLSTLDDVLQTFQTAWDSALVEGKEDAFFKELAKNVKNYTPKLWYTRILQEQLIYNQLNRMADPAYDAKMRQLERKMERETGSEYWAEPY